MNASDVLSRKARNLASIREKGVEVAQVILAEEGLSGLSARRLANDVDCSVGTLYNAFGHLDGVIRAVNVKTLDRLMDTMQAALGDKRGGFELDLTSLAGTYFDFALTHQGLWQALFEHRPQTVSDGILEARRDRLEADIRVLLGVANDSAQITSFRLLWAAVHGLITLASRDAIPGVNSAQARQYVSYLVSTMMTDELVSPSAIRDDA